jgi:hypothetical protein
MENEIKVNPFRLFKLWFLRIRNSFKNIVPEDEALVKNIISKSLDKDIKRLISPLTDEYLLIDEANELYICVGNSSVTISNHKFLYKKNLTIGFSEKLKKQIRKAIDKDRQELKKQLFTNEIGLLTNIKNKI